MRTDKEIVDRIKEMEQARVLFTFHPEILVPYLSEWSIAKPFFKPEATEEDFERLRNKRDDSVVLFEMKQYMDTYGWDKAINHRGLSAERTVDKMKAWIWLLNDGNFEKINWEKYPMYGAPILKDISDRYGFNIPTGTEIENMMAGRPCSEGCSGCR